VTASSIVAKRSFELQIRSLDRLTRRVHIGALLSASAPAE
jgi:hypothetical protein